MKNGRELKLKRKRLPPFVRMPGVSTTVAGTFRPDITLFIGNRKVFRLLDAKRAGALLMRTEKSRQLAVSFLCACQESNLGPRHYQ